MITLILPPKSGYVAVLGYKSYKLVANGGITIANPNGVQVM